MSWIADMSPSRKRAAVLGTAAALGVAVVLGGGFAIISGTSHAADAPKENCQGLDQALQNNLNFIAQQKANPTAVSAANIANREAVVAQIQQRRQAAGCTNDVTAAADANKKKGSGENCGGLQKALQNNLNFIAQQKAHPDAQSAARIKNREAVVAQIEQRLKAAGCDQNGNGNGCPTATDTNTPPATTTSNNGGMGGDNGMGNGGMGNGGMGNGGMGSGDGNMGGDNGMGGTDTTTTTTTTADNNGGMGMGGDNGMGNGGMGNGGMGNNGMGGTDTTTTTTTTDNNGGCDNGGMNNGGMGSDNGMGNGGMGNGGMGNGGMGGTDNGGMGTAAPTDTNTGSAAGNQVCKGSTVTLSGQKGVSASSNQFPVGTKLKVTNLDNNKSITVPVTSTSGSCVLLDNDAFNQIHQAGKELIRHALIQKVG